MRHRALFATIVTVALLSSGGCAPGRSRAAEPAVSKRPVAAMSVQDKRDEIAEDFPVEIPVASGIVLRGRGEVDAWDYELRVDASSKTVAGWYVEAYEGRNWQVLLEDTTGDGPLVLTMLKGGAQSRIQIEGKGQWTRVVGIVGIGAPVLMVQ